MAGSRVFSTTCPYWRAGAVTSFGPVRIRVGTFSPHRMNPASTPKPSPINVLFILNSLCVGGAEKQVISLINRIDRSRYATSLLYLKQADDLLAQIDPGSCPHGLRCLGVKKGIEWSAIRQIARHIVDHRIDIVVCTNMYALLYGWLARRLSGRGVRLVEVFHTTHIDSRKERLWMGIYRPVIRRTDLLVYVCRNQAAHWRRHGLRPRQDAVIHNGIDTQRFEDVWSVDDKIAVRRQHGFAAADYVVGLCAVMRPEKAHTDLLDAIARLRGQGVDIKGLLIGGGPDRPRVDAQIRALGLGDHVRVTGLIQDVRPAMAACDVMVLTTRTGETFSLSALEAMALGKPMVMTDIGGASEQVTHGENGWLYPAGDTQALAECLRALSDARLRATAGSKAARRVAEEFDVGGMVKGYERTLSALMVSGVKAQSANPAADPSARAGSR